MTSIEKFVYGGLVVYLLVAGAVVWSIWRDARSRDRRRGWARVRGRVSEHRLRRDELQRAFGEMRVEYEHDGVTHDRWVGSADPRGMDAAKQYVANSLLEGMAKRQPVGSETEIMVNPDDHREAYLVERELSGMLYIGIVSALFAAGFVFLAYVGREFVR